MLSTSGGSVAAHASSSLDRLLRAVRNPAESSCPSDLRCDVLKVCSKGCPGLFRKHCSRKAGDIPVRTMTSAKRGDVNHPRG